MRYNLINNQAAAVTLLWKSFFYKQLRNCIKMSFFLILCSLYFVIPGHTASKADIQMIESGTGSVTLEYVSSEIKLSERTIEGKVYQDIRIPGTGIVNEPGKPGVPFRGVLIAVPEGKDVRIEILDLEVETLSGYNISPVPLIHVEDVDGELLEEEVFSPDVETYTSDRLWPDMPVTKGDEGYIRSQRVAQIKFFPVLHNPVTSIIKVFKKIRVHVTFTSASGSSVTGASPLSTSENLLTVEDSPAFDKMLNGLLVNDKDSGRVLQSSPMLGAPIMSGAESCPDPDQGFSVKVFVEQDGMYSLSYGDFSSYGIDMSSIDPRQIQMKHLGVDIPIIITGESDGIFNTVDEIIFYGEAMTGDFTNTNVYWLSLEPGGGMRMAQRVGTPDGSPELTSFRTTEHKEQDYTYWSYMPDGEGKDHWFWDDLYGGQSLDMTFSLNNIASSVGTATVRVMLYGKSDLPQDPDHHTSILLNGVEIDDAFWNGQGTFLHEVDVPHSSLLEGENIVTVNSMNLAGVAYSIVYVNYAEIEYSDSYIAESDTLRFDGEGTGPYNMEAAGFSQSSIVLYDITDPHNAASITGADIQPDSGDYSIRYNDTLAGENRYIALTSSPSQYMTPQSMESDAPSILKDVCNRADYIIIHHDSFDVAGLLSALSGRGLALMDVKVSDIYDEFNYGIFDPQAIKDFLAYAYNNYEQPRPAYVVLVGDANQDYFNRLGYGINYIPTHIFQTDSLGDTASDNWFVSVSGVDAYPDMFLGRISVRTQAELDNVVSKIVSYENDVPQDGWGQNVLMVADDQAVFEDLNDGLIQDYLSVYNPNKVYLSQYSVVNDATQDIINNIDAGSILTIYTGHGSVSTWAGEKIFEISDIPSLNNPDRLTFVVALDCLNGWFSYYDILDYSLAEEFLLADGKGAVGMWAATGLGIPAEHEILAEELFKDLFHHKEVELGPLTTGAKISAVLNYGVSPDALEIFTLFGDPSTNLHLADINIPPTSDPGGPYAAVEGLAVILDGSGSIDPDGTIGLYEWDLDGNGTYDYSSSSPTKNHTYVQEDSYDIKLRVTDDRGGTDEATTTVDISDSLPTADFTGSPTSGLAPLTVDFTNSSTGYDQPLTYEWDFDNNGTVDSTAINPFHIYPDPGTYSVKLTVTDFDESSNTLTWTDYINVSEYVLTVNRYGSGRVVSSPSGIDCVPDCTEIYDAGTVVTITAEPADGVSPFMGWTGGGCDGTGECVVTMNADTEVSATFYECPNPSVRILDSSEGYSTIQDAYDDSSNGDTIQSQAKNFDEDLSIDMSKVITFESGFDCNYQGIAGKTILNGNMTIVNGELTMQKGTLEIY